MAPRTSSTRVPQAYAEAVSSNPHPHNPNEPPRQNSFAFHELVHPSPQPQALETSFEARLRYYMATHMERMERFENAIFKQREEINDRMTKMFGLLKELTTSRTPKKVLVREEARHPITKHVNVVGTLEEVDREDEVGNRTNNESTKNTEEDLTEEKVRELVEAPRSRPVKVYLKHKFNKELIEGLVGNQRFNDSLLAMQSGKMECEAYHSLLVEHMRKKMLKKMITKKEDMGGNFVIPCNVGGLKYMDTLVDQGSNINVMPFSTYNRLTNKKLVETEIRLSLASQSHIQLLGIAEDVLVEIAGFLYPMDFVKLYIKEYRRKPFILGTPFLTTAEVEIRFDKGAITSKSGVVVFVFDLPAIFDEKKPKGS
ncbi:MAK10-like protein [Tanacetum coccineum]